MSDSSLDPLAKVRNPDGTVHWLAVGEAEQYRRCGRATQEMIDVLDWLHANGGTGYVSHWAVEYAAHCERHVQEHVGAVIRTRVRIRNGRVTRTTTVQRFAGTLRRPCVGRRPARAREHRPAATRRASSSSSTSSADPGSDGPAHQPPVPTRAGGGR